MGQVLYSQARENGHKRTRSNMDKEEEGQKRKVRIRTTPMLFDPNISNRFSSMRKEDHSERSTNLFERHGDSKEDDGLETLFDKGTDELRVKTVEMKASKKKQGGKGNTKGRQGKWEDGIG